MREVFSEAAEITDPTARTTFLNLVGQGDDALRARVEWLFLADSRAGAFLRDRTDLIERFPEKIGDRRGR